MNFETGAGFSPALLYGALATATLIPLWAWFGWVTVKSWQLYLGDKLEFPQVLLAFFKAFALVVVATIIILV
ncbi:MAG TPA: DUF3262 family protein [Gammaproteobacteria bacterium]|nr:DUF3262 family protein [Gammaproteobacteria bacterium]